MSQESVRRPTLRSEELGQALLELRSSANASGREFLDALAEADGPRLDRAQLSYIERGQRGLAPAEWHRLIRAARTLELSASHVDRVEGLLPGVADPIESIPVRPVSRILAQWYAIARAMSGKAIPRIVVAEPGGRPGVAAALFLARYRNAFDDILRRADLAAQPAVASPDDQARVVAIEPAETVVVPNGPFEIRVRLRNAGTTPWHDDRLLMRLGPPITSTIAQTAPLLPVPPTPAGGDCEVLIPGRGHYLPGRCVVTYVMVFADGTPCVPGGLSVSIESKSDAHATFSLSQALADFLARKRRR